MGFDTSPPTSSLSLARLLGIGLIVFLANGALLVLQLAAGRLLSPFVGSSLETWTSVIGVFLTGIALGNALGGKLADRYPTGRALAALLALGAAASFWMFLMPLLLSWSGAYRPIPLGPRIGLLALLLCLPAGLVLSLITPLAIKLGLGDLSQVPSAPPQPQMASRTQPSGGRSVALGWTGRVAGLVFALSTLGCLLGNYLTGFVLIPAFTINTLVLAAAAALAALSLVTAAQSIQPAAAAAGDDKVTRRQDDKVTEEDSAAASVTLSPDHPVPLSSGPSGEAFTDIQQACLIVFLASFGGMTLEITASRFLAPYLGVSLFTWTGVIGVMLAGTALGNFLGGLLADRLARARGRIKPRAILVATLLAAAACSALPLLIEGPIYWWKYLRALDPILQVMAWTFGLFFLPMFILGMVSPQVIRLAVGSVEHVGRVAGRVYAWSTAGAIFGTFAAGYLLISTFGVYNTLLLVAGLLIVASLASAKRYTSIVLACGVCLAAGVIVAAGVCHSWLVPPESGLIARVDTNYYTIQVSEDGPRARYLTLDHLVHSKVNLDDPAYLYYTHEEMQMEFLRAARKDNPEPRVLVVGGGGYTFPRCAMEKLPETRMDVVEIDPGVTRAAKEHLGLKDYPGMSIHHMDGRQYIAEKAAAGSYDLVVQDAVNDLSVPAHLMTKEYNEAVKRILKPGGVYLLTVIDSLEHGKLWRAALETLQQSYPAENVAILSSSAKDFSGRQVYVIYASDRALDLAALQEAVKQSAGAPSGGAANGGTGSALSTHRVPAERLQGLLNGPPTILTDQYAPVDNLMAEVFRARRRR